MKMEYINKFNGSAYKEFEKCKMIIEKLEDES
jgi:hypothetical protein